MALIGEKMINTIELERVAQLIKNKTVEVLDTQYCREFNKFVTEQYPWDIGYGDLIDWDATPGYKQIKNVQLFSSEAKKFIRDSCVAKYDYLAIVYGSEKPGVIGKFDDVVNNLSNLSFHTPWVEFIIGTTKNKYGIFELVNNDFIEVWDGKCTMTAPDVASQKN